MKSLRPLAQTMWRYQLLLVVATAGLATAAVCLGERLGSPLAVGVLAVIALLAERGRVSLGENIEGSISVIPTVFAAATFGPLAAMVVGIASFLGECPLVLPTSRLTERGAPYLRWGIYTCVRAISGGVAGLAALVVRDSYGVSVVAVVGATLAAAVVAEPLDLAFNVLTMWLRGGNARSPLRALGPVVIASIPLYTPIVAVLGVAYRDWSPWTLPLFLIPALTAQRVFALFQNQRELTESLKSTNVLLNGANVQLEKANLQFAFSLVTTLDARDQYTAGHSTAVAVYARDIAARMGLSDEQQALAHLCGLVHDIGKIGLPAGLLEKPGALTLEERRKMQEHSEIGERILAEVDSYAEIASIVRHHHERVDGQGYPDGISSEEIPLLARIIAVADAYNAMTSNRPYREAMPSRVARMRLAQSVETQFDTTIVAAFEAVLAGGSEDYRIAKGHAFKRTDRPELQPAEPRQLSFA